ncbi:MAG: hypothetical protein WA324_13685 [Bryobacteraceae bacterium]
MPTFLEWLELYGGPPAAAAKGPPGAYRFRNKLTAWIIGAVDGSAVRRQLEIAAELRDEALEFGVLAEHLVVEYGRAADNRPVGLVRETIDHWQKLWFRWPGSIRITFWPVKEMIEYLEKVQHVELDLRARLSSGDLVITGRSVTGELVTRSGEVAARGFDFARGSVEFLDGSILQDAEICEVEKDAVTASAPRGAAEAGAPASEPDGAAAVAALAAGEAEAVPAKSKGAAALAAADAAPPAVPERPRIARTHGPKPGRVRRFDADRRALFPEIDRIMATERSSLSAVCLQLAREGRVPGTGSAESCATGLRNLYQKERHTG